jgi:hypothetical protein
LNLVEHGRDVGMLDGDDLRGNNTCSSHDMTLVYPAQPQHLAVLVNLSTPSWAQQDHVFHPPAPPTHDT